MPQVLPYTSNTQPLLQGGKYTPINRIPEDITNHHPTYIGLIASRVKCRDVVSGQDTIKGKKEQYLPRLSGQSEEDYKNYLYRALFFSIGSKSLQALVGMASLKEPKIVASKDMADKYFDFSENSHFLETFIKLLTEILLQNQAGLLVDWPVSGGDAFVNIFNCESIINWDYDDEGNLSLIVIKESYSHKVNKYKKETRYRYRELCIENGQYVQKLHTEGLPTQVIKPLVLNQPLSYIPFFPIHSKGLGFTDEPPLFLDIANINISHYLSSADLEHGRHFTGLPTPIVTGANSDKPLHVGSTQFIILPDKNANAKYLEFSGQGLQSLEKALAEKQAMLASLSARLLDNSSKGSEATDAVKLRYLSETASLTTVVKTINIVLNKVYNIIAESNRESAKSVSIKLDTDFLTGTLGAAEMSSLFDGYLTGALDLSTLVFNLRRGQILDPSKSDEEIAEAVIKRAAEISLNSQNQSKKPTE